MGPPTAVPLRDVSCVMILLHLSILLSLPPSQSSFPSGSNFWQDFKMCWMLYRNMKHYISKQANKCACVCMQMHCGALQGTAGNGQVHFLAPRGCLTSGVHAARPLHHLCSTSVPPLLTSQPRRTESGRAFVMLTLLKHHCRDRLLPHSAIELFSPSYATSVHQQGGKNPQKQSNILEEVVLSVSPLSL